MKVAIGAVLFVLLAGCAGQHGRPVLKDANGWPYPTWAQREGLTCYDAELKVYVDARYIGTASRDYVCGFGAVNRGVYYDPGTQYGRTTQSVSSQVPSRPPSAPSPDVGGSTVVR